MSRSVRITVGAVIAGALAFVAIVAGAMSSVGSYGYYGDPFMEDWTIGVDTAATAEVLDVDDDTYDDWPMVDVRYTTDDGELVVTAVDWEWTDDFPEVGDQVEVMYEAADPEWAFAADDPYVTEELAAADEGEGTSPDTAAATGSAVAEVAGWVALAALLGVVLTTVLTVVAAVLAPPRVDLAAAYGTGRPVLDPFALNPAPAQYAQAHNAPAQYAPSPGPSGSDGPDRSWPNPG